MIDKQVFADLLNELSGYYKREFTPFVKRVWFKYLSDHLNTEEFVRSVEQVIISKQFMPTPQELVEAVRGNLDAQALKEWEVCLKAAAAADYGVAERLTAQGKFALRAIGSVSRLGRTDESEHKWVRKEFISAWLSWSPSIGSVLPPAQQESALPQGAF